MTTLINKYFSILFKLEFSDFYSIEFVKEIKKIY